MQRDTIYVSVAKQITLAWVYTLWATVGGENSPPFIILGFAMRELSVFIDESGDFGKPTHLPANYLVTFVFHDQDNDISKNVAKLDESLSTSGFEIDYIHMGPIVRREDVFRSMTLDERRRLAYKMLNFYTHCQLLHKTIIINRKEAMGKVELSGKLAKELKIMLDDNFEYFSKFDKIIVYYDNGQIELSSILNAIMSTCLSNVEFRTAEPQKYKLLQVADFVCTLELLNIKHAQNLLSNSEKKFFFKPQELQKSFIKTIAKDRL